MCEANVFLKKNDKEQLIMESVDTVEPYEGGLRVMNIFGDQKFLKAKIHSLALVEHKVILVEDDDKG